MPGSSNFSLCGPSHQHPALFCLAVGVIFEMEEANEEDFSHLKNMTRSFKDAMKGQGVKASLPCTLMLTPRSVCVEDEEIGSEDVEISLDGGGPLTKRA